MLLSRAECCFHWDLHHRSKANVGFTLTCSPNYLYSSVLLSRCLSKYGTDFMTCTRWAVLLYVYCGCSSGWRNDVFQEGAMDTGGYTSCDRLCFWTIGDTGACAHSEVPANELCKRYNLFSRSNPCAQPSRVLHQPFRDRKKHHRKRKWLRKRPWTGRAKMLCLVKAGWGVHACGPTVIGKSSFLSSFLP